MKATKENIKILRKLGFRPDIELNDSKLPDESDCIEMGLCEVKHVMLRPNQLYRFVVMPGCKKCEKLDVYKSPKRKNLIKIDDGWWSLKCGWQFRLDAIKDFKTLVKRLMMAEWERRN